MTCILFIVHHKSIIITVTTFVTILDTINVSSDLVIVVMLMLWEPYGEIRSNTVLETKIVESSMRRDWGGGNEECWRALPHWDSVCLLVVCRLHVVLITQLSSSVPEKKDDSFVWCPEHKKDPNNSGGYHFLKCCLAKQTSQSAFRYWDESEDMTFVTSEEMKRCTGHRETHTATYIQYNPQYGASSTADGSLCMYRDFWTEAKPLQLDQVHHNHH